MLKANQMIGQCEICEGESLLLTKQYGNMWICDPCHTKEQAASEEHQSVEAQNKRLEVLKQNDVVRRAQKIDTTINLKQDIANAATISIMELVTALQADDSIENKHFALGQILVERINQYSQVIFDKRAELNRLESEKYAFQTHLNQISNSLRKEEREKLKLQDVAYQPVSPKSPKPPKEKIVKTTKGGLQAVRELAAKFSIDANAIQAIVVGRHTTPEDAANILLKMLGRNPAV